ncbi:MAG: L-histidine N(alpha)-methyltransferase [Gammaproteobacteria bacterium]|nr:L-histidine N(alpha)-methyltransferase [Gammaproteobacteria bacterium]
METNLTKQNIQFHDLHATRSDFLGDVLSGLRKRPASIPPKYFYDAKGSQLFDAITELPEYYPTRTEIGILNANAAEIARHVGTGSLLVEPGGGSCAKVHILLEGLQPCAYVPMDISKDHLRLAAKELAAAYPWLEIHAACTDFTQQMEMPPSAPGGTRVAFFPGSSIGNFKPQDAIVFLNSIAELVGTGGYLLIGVDLKKDRAILQAAYDDAAGITAQFNLNLLAHINRELNADFDLETWQHKALYNESKGRIEMHLISRREQTVTVDGQSFHFSQGEGIHTENSYKYTVDEFNALAAQAGFQSDACWLDDNSLFSVHLYRVQGG